MPALAPFALLLAAGQDVPVKPQDPQGWGCRARTAIAPAAEVSLSQGMGYRGDRSMVRTGIVTLSRPGGQFQSMVWHGAAGGNPAGPPQAVLLGMPVTKRDWKGMVRLEADGRSFYLPATGTLSWRKGEDQGVDIKQPDAVEALWTAARWRVAVLDSKGVELGAAEGALPGREAILAAFARLVPDLDGQMADPGKGGCWALGPDADI